MISRRKFCLAAAATALVPGLASAGRSADSGFALLRDRALAALTRHGSKVTKRDAIGIVDFSLPSRQPRFFILDLVNGGRETLFVAHGKGSDPAHSGWLETFSNAPGSEATSAGAYLTDALYVGKHGRSRRLIGLEDRNSNAETRAIVIHGAWYVSENIVRQRGKLGRSQGCLAVAEHDIEHVLARLGPGRLIYADRV